jgi:hypothetical protein
VLWLQAQCKGKQVAHPGVPSLASGRLRPVLQALVLSTQHAPPSTAQAAANAPSGATGAGESSAASAVVAGADDDDVDEDNDGDAVPRAAPNHGVATGLAEVRTQASMSLLMYSQ